jgi:predicted RNase H-like HicB family nuclease
MKQIKKNSITLDYYLNLKYPVTIYEDPEGGFVAEIEDLPGCLTQGETLEEVHAQIDDARRGWLKVAYEEGLEISLPRTDQEYSGKFIVRLPKYLHKQLAQNARKDGISLNQYVISILSSNWHDQDLVIGEVKDIKAAMNLMLKELRRFIPAVLASEFNKDREIATLAVSRIAEKKAVYPDHEKS